MQKKNLIRKKLGAFILVFFVCNIILTSCNSTHDNNKTSNQIDTLSNEIIVPNFDTTISLTINGIRKSFIINKTNHIDFLKFQFFLNKYLIIPPVYIDTVFIDIDGDKKNEVIISKIETRNGDCTIFSRIILNDKIVRYDTLRPNNDLAFMDWRSDSIYYKLRPYSSFYDALLDKNVVNDVENGVISDGLIDFYINGITVQLENKGYDSGIIKKETDSIKNELLNYKGKFVLTLEHWDRSLLIWNKYNKEFELLYSP